MRLSTQQLKTLKSTALPRHFDRMLKEIPGRVNIVAEGDSWFDYPRKFLLGGPPSNVIDHIQRKVQHSANLLRLESNGHEALQILSGDQKTNLCKVLESAVKIGNPVDMILFSGGGNDIAGRYRLDVVLKKNASRAVRPQDCFLASKLRNRFKLIELGYRELLDLCARYSPTTVVVTHTYDRPYPDGRKAEFLKVIRAGPWLKEFLDAAGVPTRLQRRAVGYLIDEFASMLERLAEKHPKQLVVVDTRGTIKKKAHWKDEMHPTSDGFALVAKKIYADMRKLSPALPPWKKRAR